MLRLKLFLERYNQSRLADPRFARQRHHTAFPAHRPAATGEPAVPILRPGPLKGYSVWSRAAPRSGSPPNSPTAPSRLAQAPAMPLSSFGPRSSSSNRLPTSFRVLSAITTLFASAIPCKRAARLGVLPTMHGLLPEKHPIRSWSPTTTQPGRNADTGSRNACVLRPLTAATSEFQPRAHGSLGIVFVSLRVAEVDQHAVSHELRHEPTEAMHGVRNALLIGRDDLAQRSSGSMRADKRRRADQVRRTSPLLGGARRCPEETRLLPAGPGGAVGPRVCIWPRRAAMASRYCRQRCQTMPRRPSSFRSSSRQAQQDRLVNLVMAERSLILSEAHGPQPDHDVHDEAPQSRVSACIIRRGSEGVEGGVGGSAWPHKIRRGSNGNSRSLIPL